MATSLSSNADNASPRGPEWASWLGVVAIVLGILLTATHGNEWMKQVVVMQSTPTRDQVPAADCPRDELVEEDLSVAECKQMVSNVRNLVVSSPSWFPAFQATLAAVGTVIAFLSVVVGAALVNFRGWAPAAAMLTFGALAAIDLIGFIGAVNTGPILRSLYLWDILVWFFIHLMMMAGIVAARHV